MVSGRGLRSQGACTFLMGPETPLAVTPTPHPYPSKTYVLSWILTRTPLRIGCAFLPLLILPPCRTQLRIGSTCKSRVCFLQLLYSI